MDLGDGRRIELAGPGVADDGSIGRGEPLAGGSEGRYPNVDGKHLGTGYLHGYAIASVAVFPLQVRDGRLLLSNSVSIVVETAPANRTSKGGTPA